jgi:uncharacterized SAM-binding protein YcdF (DUF218 family)
MIAAASKLLALPFYPLGLALLLAAAGVILLFLRRYAPGRVVVICAAAELWLFSSDPLSPMLVRSLESACDPAAAFPDAPAIVLLCGGEVPALPPRLYEEINDAGDRILYAARLIKQGAAPRLVITGGNVPFMREIGGSLAQVNRRLLIGALGVDSSAILLEQKSRNTYENAVFTKKLLDSLRLPPAVILVTSAMHMRRASALFRKAGCTVYPAPTDYRADVPFRLNPVSFFPNAAALNNSTCALHEIYGIIAYKLLGRL